MADPTARVSSFGASSIDYNRLEAVIKNSEALVQNALLAIDTSTGLVEFMDDAKNLMPVGQVINSWDGIADNLTGDGSTKKSVSCAARILVGSDGNQNGVSVAGATALTDFGKLVFATDGQTLTLTRPSCGLPVGFVIKWMSSTYCHVYLFSIPEMLLLSKFSPSPSGYFRKTFGFFPTNAIQGTNAADIRVETSYEHYKILSLHAIPTSFDNGLVGGSQTLNLEIGSTNVTGGVLTLAYTSFDATGDMGTVIDATAITAENEVHIGDVVTLELVASGTGMTADMHGAFEVFALCERLPGA
jgi:hypothetical protein